MSALVNHSVFDDIPGSFHRPSDIAVSAELPADDEGFVIHDSMWEAVDFLTSEAVSPSQLHTSIKINGCPMHFEAYLVDDAGDFCDSRHQKAIASMKLALEDDESWQTITYRDHQYVVIALPFGHAI